MNTTLFEKERFKVLRPEAEDCRRNDETEEEKERLRGPPATDAARLFALTGLELGGGGIGVVLVGSPARSAGFSRFRLIPGGSDVIHDEK